MAPRVGMRVRAMRDQWDITAGKEYEIVSVDSDTSMIRVRDDVGDDWWLAAGEYEPVATHALTIQEGRYYRTRSGLRVGPAMPGGDPDYPWWVGGTTYTDNGSLLTGGVTDNQDLVAEWRDDEPDTDALSRWATGKPAAAPVGTGNDLEDNEFELTAIGRAYADGYAAGVAAVRVGAAAGVGAVS